MLALKKVVVKKLIVYFSIIFFMLMGSIYLLYLNKSLVSRKPLVVDSVDRFNNISTAAAPADAQSTGANNSGQPAAASQLKNNGGLDLTIFSNKKFIELKDNVSVPRVEPNLGKRDPFLPN